MDYKTKSLIMGRMKRTNEHYPLFVHLFDENDPHLGAKVPAKFLKFDDVGKVIVAGLDFNYLLTGNDIVINDLVSVTIKKEADTVYLTGKQKK